MSQQLINLGATANDGTGSPLRAGGTDINANFTELYQTISHVFNVKNYGALGDGLSDDTAAIQAALDAANAAGGGLVYGPPGTYRHSGLNVYASTVLSGAGRGLTIWKLFAVAGEQIFGVRLRGNFSGIQDCTVQGVDATSSGGFAMSITNSASFCTIRRVESTNAWIGFGCGGIDNQPTLRWDNCNYNLLDNCYIHDVGVVTATFYAPVNAFGNRMVNCVFKNTIDASASGAELRNQIGSVIEGCHSESVRNSYRFEEASVGCVISHCTSKGSSLYGFYALAYTSTTGASGETRDCEFVGCTSNGDGEGFVIQNADRTSCVGCVVVGQTAAGGGNNGGYRISGTSGSTQTSADCAIASCEARGGAGAGLVLDSGGWGARAKITAFRAISNGGNGVQIRGAGNDGYLSGYFYDNTSIGVNIATAVSGWLIEGRAVGTANQTRGLFDNDRAQNIGDWIVSGHASLDRRAARWDRVRSFQFSLATPAVGVATQADTVSTVAGNKQGVTLPQAGSVVGVALDLAAARTGGTETGTVLLNGSSTGFTVVIDGTNTQSFRTVQAVNINVFAAGDRLSARFTSDASWAPATNGVVTVFVEFHNG